MRSSIRIWSLALIVNAPIVTAAEVTLQNDALVDNSQATLVLGFASGEKAAAWLTSSCSGNMVAVDVLWRSLHGGAPQVIEQAIEISNAGTPFPNPGTLLQSIDGPVLTDGVINEYRYLDDQSTIPLSVPVLQGQTYVVAFVFDTAPDPAEGPTVVADTGCQANKNALFGDIGAGNNWYNACSLGVTGDWVIRAVVNCQATLPSADVSVTLAAAPALYTPGMGLDYTITIGNAGPADSPNTTVVDVLPAGYTGAGWTCNPSGGAVCTLGASGSGNITGAVSVPAAGQIVFNVTGSVANGTTGVLSNSATTVVGSPASDPNASNNTATVTTPPISDRIFADSFEGG